MKIGKPKSKRVPVRLRHKIEKASAAKQRKVRRQAKKNPEWRTRLKKDPGIPNLWPFKEKLLNEIEQQRESKRQEAEDKRKKAKGVVEEDEEEVADGMEVDENGDAIEDPWDLEENADGDLAGDDDANPMAALLASAKARAAQFDGGRNHDGNVGGESDDDDDRWNGFEEAAVKGKKDTSRRAFDKLFKEVLATADVILYVLDARDPEGTRSREIERQIMSVEGGQKRLILILNKIDLIPGSALKGWLTHLRRYFPTLPLRASGPAANAKVFDHKKLSVKGTSEALFKALKAFSEGRNLKRGITVGVVGFPNVGKSSVINALTSRMGGKGVCTVGAEAGVTTGVKQVKVDGRLKILDCPGIVFPSEASGAKAKVSKEQEKARLVLLNAVPPKEIDDPIPAVKMLIKRLSASQFLLDKLYEVYNLPTLMINANDGDTMTDFLVQVARKRGRLGKGGVPNLHSAAQAVLTDWRDGRIQGWMDPPTLQESTTANGKADEKVVVTEWAAEFKLDGLWGFGDELPPEDDEEMEG